jgi:monoamine oxidase
MQRGKSFRAIKVIISIPAPLYRTIKFSPPLPEYKTTLADSTTLGYYAKTLFIQHTPRGHDTNFSGSFILLNGAVPFSFDTSIDDDDRYSITCFSVGGTGRKWSILSPIKRSQTVLDQIASMIGDKHGHRVYETDEVIEMEWIKEPWSQGAPSPVMEPGLLNKYGDVLRAPCGNLHFLGTETMYEWKGYMDGAISAGERGAQEVNQGLRNSAGSKY